MISSDANLIDALDAAHTDSDFGNSLCRRAARRMQLMAGVVDAARKWEASVEMGVSRPDIARRNVILALNALDEDASE